MFRLSRLLQGILMTTVGIQAISKQVTRYYKISIIINYMISVKYITIKHVDNLFSMSDDHRLTQMEWSLDKTMPNKDRWDNEVWCDRQRHRKTNLL